MMDVLETCTKTVARRYGLYGRTPLTGQIYIVFLIYKYTCTWFYIDFAFELGNVKVRPHCTERQSRSGVDVTVGFVIRPNTSPTVHNPRDGGLHRRSRTDLPGEDAAFRLRAQSQSAFGVL